MLIESKDGQYHRQRCHRCHEVKEQDYLKLVKVGDTVEFECADGCFDDIDLTDENGNVETYEVRDGIITNDLITKIAMAFLVVSVLMFSLGFYVAAALAAAEVTR